LPEPVERQVFSLGLFVDRHELLMLLLLVRMMVLFMMVAPPVFLQCRQATKRALSNSARLGGRNTEHVLEGEDGDVHTGVAFSSAVLSVRGRKWNTVIGWGTL